MDKTEELCKIFGVKEGQEFRILNTKEIYEYSDIEKHKFVFEKDYGFRRTNIGITKKYEMEILNSLIIGELEIKKETLFEKIKEMDEDQLAEELTKIYALNGSNYCNPCSININLNATKHNIKQQLKKEV